MTDLLLRCSHRCLAWFSFHAYGRQRQKTYLVRPAKSQISLCIRTGRSDSSLGNFDSQDLKFLHMESEESDHTVRMNRLIGVFVGLSCQKVCFSRCVLHCINRNYIQYDL